MVDRKREEAKISSRPRNNKNSRVKEIRLIGCFYFQGMLFWIILPN